MPDINTSSPGRGSSSSSSTYTSDHDATEKGSIAEPPPVERVPTRFSRITSRRYSRDTDDSDPLEPLELALTPDLRFPSEHAVVEPISHIYTASSAVEPISHIYTASSAASRPIEYEVTFDDDDPENPRNWPLWYRLWVLIGLSFTTWTVVVYSTSYTAAIPGYMNFFHEKSEPVATLGVTTYLLGLAVGCVVVAPMSEVVGRRPVYLVCTAIYALLIIPAAKATSLAEIIVVRFFGAVFGSALVSNSPATAVDISTETNRVIYMSLISIAPLNGPVTGPLIGGFVYQYLGWRWDSWLPLILTGAGLCVLLTIKETYAPAILKAKAARIRKETGDDLYWCRYDLRVSVMELLKVNLSRPFILSATEPILWFFNLWISIVYGILYLCFVAYPIVFSQHRGWSSGVSGLAFIGIGIGTMMAVFSEPLCRRLINSHAKDPETGRAPPEASARVMLIGAILTPIGQLVFSWTCLPTRIHWAIPIAFGIPFGAGNTLTFIYSSNYLANAYGIYAASALAGNMVMRSFFGGTLPLAGPSMYKAMTPQWAGTLLGLMELAMIAIPLTFLRYGERIRGKSRIIRQMREDSAKAEAKHAKQLARYEARKAKEEACRAKEEALEARRAKEEALETDGRAGAETDSNASVKDRDETTTGFERDIEKGAAAAQTHSA